MKKKLALVCLFAIVLAPMSYGFGSRKRKRRRHIARQKASNQQFQQSIINAFNVDAMRGAAYDNGLRELEQVADLRGQTGAFSEFGSLNSEIPTFRLLDQARGMFTERRGEHTSTSLPFYDTSSGADLAHALEAVKISEAALKELRSSGGGAAGGFQMMKFLQDLMGKVSQGQKGLVNGMLVLITVPYFATLASAWWMGPNTAMDITWPMAKEGIAGMIEQVLKRFGRISMGMNLDSFMPGNMGGMGGLGDIGGGLGNMGGLGDLGGNLGDLGGGLTSPFGNMSMDSFGGGLGQLNDTLGQVNDSLGNVGLSLSDAGKSPGQLIGKVAGNAAGAAAGNLNLGDKLGLGTVELGPLGEVDLAAQFDRQVQKQVQKQVAKAGEKLGEGLEFGGPLGELNDKLGDVNRSLSTAGLSLGDAGSTPFELVSKVGTHAGKELGSEAAERLGVNDLKLGPIDVGNQLERQLQKGGVKVTDRVLETLND